ncbi:MAG: hypothetical protein LBQ86_00700 [Holophagales bacterium]|jgi:hypothetical protein|nr:hypothetical protein [Holophagales bacterium]
MKNEPEQFKGFRRRLRLAQFNLKKAGRSEPGVACKSWSRGNDGRAVSAAMQASQAKLAMVVVVLLCLQLAFLWLQGSLLNRQRAEIVNLRSEIQKLTITLNEIIIADETGYTTPVQGPGSHSKRLRMDRAAQSNEKLLCGGQE